MNLDLLASFRWPLAFLLVALVLIRQIRDEMKPIIGAGGTNFSGAVNVNQ